MHLHEQFMHVSVIHARVRFPEDGMAIIGEYGNPTFWITFTCNPHWDEITRALLPGQSSSDRPDIMVRYYYHFGRSTSLPFMPVYIHLTTTTSHLRCDHSQARVFNIKLNTFVKEIRSGDTFGVPSQYILADMEFQKVLLRRYTPTNTLQHTTNHVSLQHVSLHYCRLRSADYHTRTSQYGFRGPSRWPLRTSTSTFPLR